MLLLITIDPGWYIYGPTTDSSGLPTTVEWRLPRGFSAGRLEWPPLSDPSRSAYTDQVLLMYRMVAPSDIEAGQRATIGVSVSWLACADQCIPGDALCEVEVRSSLETPKRNPEAAVLMAQFRAGPDDRSFGSSGLDIVMAILLGLAGGLLLNLMPCVLPVLSLKVLSIKKRAEDDKASSLLHGSLFAAGVLVSFWILVGLLLAVRAGGSALGWGFQLQNPVFVALMACLFFIIALNFFGVFEIGLSAAKFGASSGRSGKIASFLSGVLAVLVATPCAAPFMGAAIGYALASSAQAAFAVFTALAIGFAAPVFALSVIGKRMPSPRKRGPSIGRSSALLRAILGFPMAASAVWLAGLLAKLSGPSAVIGLLWAFIALGLGAFVWRSWGAPDGTRRARTAAGIGAILLFFAGAALAAGAAGFSRAPEAESSSSSSAGVDGLWRPWSPEAEAELRASGRVVFVDFTASWCLTCAANEALALKDRRVLARFDELGAAALKADWTARDERIALRLASFGRAGVPLYVLYVPGSPPRVLPELLTPEIVLEALRDVDRR